VSPRYQGEPGRVEDAARLGIDVADAPLPARLHLGLRLEDELSEGGRVESPSHAVEVERRDGASFVRLRDEGGSRLDRDVVVRWPVARPEVGLSVGVGRPARGEPRHESAFGLLTVVPPAEETPLGPMARDLVVLLDTSGSMSGEPLEQARRLTSALVDSLAPADTFELLEFSDVARRWRAHPAEATPSARRDALRWLAGLRASGCTEMVDALFAALRPLRPEAQRQVVLVTDGQVGFEGQVVQTVLATLPAGSRLHVVAVGEAANRSLSHPAARAGRGLELVVGLDEDVERVVQRLLARTVAPVVTELELSGSALVAAAPERLPDLFAGAPVLLGVQVLPSGGELVVRGRTAKGPWSATTRVPAVEPGQGQLAAVALFGRELAEDLEMHAAAGEPSDELDARLERVGLDFRLSTRLTSWVAVSEEASVDPRSPMRRVKVAHELPHGVSALGLGLRAASASATGAGVAARMRGRPGSLGAMDLAARPAPAAHVMRSMHLEAEAAPSMPSDRGLKKKTPPDGWEAEPLTPRARPGGRFVLWTGHELVVELTVGEGGLEWQAPEQVALTFSDGASVRALVVEAKSTRFGRYTEGQVLRITLAVGEPDRGRKPSRLLLELPGGITLDVDL
jgi:Ca-activated chloride channel family protein